MKVNHMQCIGALILIFLLTVAAVAQAAEKTALSLVNETTEELRLLFAIQEGRYRRVLDLTDERPGWFCCGRPERWYDLIVVPPGTTELICEGCKQDSRAVLEDGNWKPRDVDPESPLYDMPALRFGQTYYLRSIDPPPKSEKQKAIAIHEGSAAVISILFSNDLLGKYGGNTFEVENLTEDQITVSASIHVGQWGDDTTPESLQRDIEIPAFSSISVSCTLCLTVPIRSVSGPSLSSSPLRNIKSSEHDQFKYRLVDSLYGRWDDGGLNGRNLVVLGRDGYFIVYRSDPPPSPAPPEASGHFYIANAQASDVSLRIGPNENLEIGGTSASLRSVTGNEFTCINQPGEAYSMLRRGILSELPSQCFVELNSGVKRVVRRVEPGRRYLIIWDTSQERFDLRVPD